MTFPRFTQDYGEVATQGARTVTAGSVSSQILDEGPVWKWRPCAIEQFPTPDHNKLRIPAIAELETFTWEFIVSTFGGQQWSPGFYWVPSGVPSLLQNRSYCILDPDYEPYLPATPGEHGAKATAIFNDASIDENGLFPDSTAYEHMPVFISLPTTSNDSEAKRYIYFGTYSRSRNSDRMDYDTQSILIPEAVKEYWADQLTSPERPAWVDNKLMQHFWPKPTYKGPLPTTSPTEQTEHKVQRAMTNYLEDLRHWEKEARLEVSQLTRDDIMNAFDEPDASPKPSLRLWWEYLCFTSWDKGFYDMLVYKKRYPFKPVTEVHEEKDIHEQRTDSAMTQHAGRETDGVSDDEIQVGESASGCDETVGGAETECVSDEEIKIGESASVCDKAVGGTSVDKFEKALQQAGRTRGLFSFGERDDEEIYW
ncbi:hypothetical protein MBLNU457_6359t1 [Dothideomycetes sp. NU457]